MGGLWGQAGGAWGMVVEGGSWHFGDDGGEFVICIRRKELQNVSVLLINIGPLCDGSLIYFRSIIILTNTRPKLLGTSILICCFNGSTQLLILCLLF